MFSAALLVGCGANPDSEPTMIETAEAALAEYDETYGCLNRNVSIEVSDDQNLFVMPSPNTNQIFYLDAVATETGRILLNSELLAKEAVRSTILREAVHACIDRTDFSEFDTPLETSDGSGTKVIGANGFRPIFLDENGIEGTNPFIEEGLAEWVAESFDDFKTTGDRDEYGSLRELMKNLAAWRGLDVEQVLLMQEADNLRGFTAVVFGKDRLDVTGDDIVGIAWLFQTTMEQDALPTIIQVKEALAIKN